MNTFKGLLVLSALFYSNSATFDGCPEITTARASEIFQTGLFADGTPTFYLRNRVPNCFSAGQVRGLYRFATYTSQFESSDFEGLQHLQIDIRCSPTTGMWNAETNAQLLTDQDDIDLLFNNDTLRTDCSSCSRLETGNDPVTHCVDCADECSDEGHDLCHGSTIDDCCNFYFNDRCVTECPTGYIANSDFDCDCPPNFGGDNCEDCILPNCQVCSTVAGECLACYEGFVLDDHNHCVIDCTRCDLLSGIIAQNACTYFCQLEAWTEEVMACGLNIPDITSPNFTVITETPEDLQESATEAAEIADGAWSDEAVQAFSFDVEAPVYGSNIADWQEGIRKYIMNLQTWLEYAETLNSNLPTRESELSSLLQDIGSRSPAEIYDDLQALWLGITHDFTNLIALDQCPL